MGFERVDVRRTLAAFPHLVGPVTAAALLGLLLEGVVRLYGCCLFTQLLSTQLPEVDVAPMECNLFRHIARSLFISCYVSCLVSISVLFSETLPENVWRL